MSIAQKEDDCPFKKDPPRGGLVEWFKEFRRRDASRGVIWKKKIRG